MGLVHAAVSASNLNNGQMRVYLFGDSEYHSDKHYPDQSSYAFPTDEIIIERAKFEGNIVSGEITTTTELYNHQYDTEFAQLPIIIKYEYIDEKDKVVNRYKYRDIVLDPNMKIEAKFIELQSDQNNNAIMRLFFANHNIKLFESVTDYNKFVTKYIAQENIINAAELKDADFIVITHAALVENSRNPGKVEKVDIQAFKHMENMGIQSTDGEIAYLKVYNAEHYFLRHMMNVGHKHGTRTYIVKLK